MAFGLWLMASGLWLLACGLWFMAYGLWTMDYSSWLTADGLLIMIHGASSLKNFHWRVLRMSYDPTHGNELDLR